MVFNMRLSRSCGGQRDNEWKGSEASIKGYDNKGNNESVCAGSSDSKGGKRQSNNKLACER